jgi:hypothetical protein
MAFTPDGLCENPCPASSQGENFYHRMLLEAFSRRPLFALYEEAEEKTECQATPLRSRQHLKG